MPVVSMTVHSVWPGRGAASGASTTVTGAGGASLCTSRPASCVAPSPAMVTDDELQPSHRDGRRQRERQRGTGKRGHRDARTGLPARTSTSANSTCSSASALPGGSTSRCRAECRGRERRRRSRWGASASRPRPTREGARSHRSQGSGRRCSAGSPNALYSR